MTNTVYDNTVLEAKLTELLNSKLEVRSLMTIDDSLAQGAGLIKTINRYTYTGVVEQLEGGAANSVCGTITFKPETYTVKRYQQTFKYNDVEAMQDPGIVDMAISGAADVMANQIRREYFGELAKTSRRHAISGDALTYSDVVAALSDIGREVEDGLFIIMSSDCRAAIRNDSDFVSARRGEIVYTGQIGTLCGLPVLFSALVPSGKAIITDKNAVKFFVKKEASLEQDRNIETKDNTIVYERHGVIALVDDTGTVILGAPSEELTVTAALASGKATLTVSGVASQSNTICFKKDADASLLGDDVSSWETLAADKKLPAAAGDVFAVTERDADGKAVSSCVVKITA